MRGRQYVLSFNVGDASNACRGSLMVEAYAGRESIKVVYAPMCASVIPIIPVNMDYASWASAGRRCGVVLKLSRSLALAMYIRGRPVTGLR
jgi:hypothetical protein